MYELFLIILFFWCMFVVFLTTMGIISLCQLIKDKHETLS